MSFVIDKHYENRTPHNMSKTSDNMALFKSGWSKSRSLTRTTRSADLHKAHPPQSGAFSRRLKYSLSSKE